MVANIFWVDTAELGSTGYSLTISAAFMEYFLSFTAFTISRYSRVILPESGYNAALAVLAPSTLVTKTRDRLGKWALSVASL